MKYNCTFYLDKEKNGFCPINAGITYAGVRLRYYIGFRVKKEYFVSIQNEYGANQQVKKNSIGLEGKTIVKYNAINNRLNEIRTELSNIFQTAKEAPDKKLIIERLNLVCCKVEPEKEVVEYDIWKVFDRYVETVDVSPMSRKQIKSVVKHFKDFELVLHSILLQVKR